MYNYRVAEKIRVLVVDDHPQVVKFISLGLKIKGFEVITAESGRAALEAARSSGLDVIILDIRLPDIEGFEVLGELRKFSKLPVIACSTVPEYHERALRYGANLFMAKPFGIDELATKLHQVINNRLTMIESNYSPIAPVSQN